MDCVFRSPMCIWSTIILPDDCDRPEIGFLKETQFLVPGKGELDNAL
jgi:hypothetical protein